MRLDQGEPAAEAAGPAAAAPDEQLGNRTSHNPYGGVILEQLPNRSEAQPLQSESAQPEPPVSNAQRFKCPIAHCPACAPRFHGWAGIQGLVKH